MLRTNCPKLEDEGVIWNILLHLVIFYEGSFKIGRPPGGVIPKLKFLKSRILLKSLNVLRNDDAMKLLRNERNQY